MAPYSIHTLVSSYIFTIFCSLAATSLSAQVQDTLLQEIVITEKKDSQQTNLLPTIELSKNELLFFGPQDPVRAINQQAGVFIQSGALNTHRITIRGIGARTPYGSDKVRMYLDNIPVTSGAGVSTLEAFDFGLIEKMQIIKGPKGNQFGANLGGAILLNSHTISDHSALAWQSTLGSFGVQQHTGSVLYSKKKGYLKAAAAFSNADGFRSNSAFDRNSYLLNGGIQLGKKIWLKGTGLAVSYDAQIASSLNENDFENNPEKAASNWGRAEGKEKNNFRLVGLTLENPVSKTSRLTTTIFFTRTDKTEIRPFNYLLDLTQNMGLRTLLDGEKDSWKWQGGLEYQVDNSQWETFDNLYLQQDVPGSVQGNKLTDNQEERIYFQAFGQLSHHFEKSFWIETGLAINQTRFSYNGQNLTDSTFITANRDFGFILLPHISAKWRPKQGNIWFANISRGFSTPSVEETLNPEGVANPDIKRADGINIEVGWLRNWENFQLEWSLYQMYIKNLLVARRIQEDVFTGINAGQTQHSGLEWQLASQHNLSDQIRLSTRTSYTFNHHVFSEFIDDSSDFSGNRLPGVPRHRLNAIGTISHEKGFSLAVTFQYIDAMPITDDNAIYNQEYSLWHTQIAYKHSGKINGELIFRVNNVFDNQYARSIVVNARGFGGNPPRFYYPGAFRNYQVSLQIQLPFKSTLKKNNSDSPH